MAAYVIELARSDRSACHGPECKKGRARIEKDALRLGTVMYFDETPLWRHLRTPCLTRIVAQNVVKSGGLEAADGWRTLSPAAQAEAKAALAVALRQTADAASGR